MKEAGVTAAKLGKAAGSQRVCCTLFPSIKTLGSYLN